MCYIDIMSRQIDWHCGGSVEELTADRLNQPAAVCARVNNSACSQHFALGLGRGGFVCPGKDESSAAACLMGGFTEALIMAR
jgi:hypothetical protein